MEDITLKIGGRKIPLRFKMKQFIEMEEELGNLGEIRDLLLNDKHRLKTLVFSVKVMGNAGLKAAGEKADLTTDWLEENMEPHQLMVYQIAVLACLSRGSESEAVTEDNENHERDLVLEQIQAKKEPVNSQPGE